MHIIVCCKGVPEGVSNVRLITGEQRIDYDCDSIDFNESDEAAVEEALALKGEYSGEVTVLTLGGLRTQSILYKARAKGVDSAVRIDAEFNDPAIISSILARCISTMEYDLILVGLESSDNMQAQTGISLAQRLNLPSAFAVTAVEIQPEHHLARVTRELGQGIYEVIDLPLPALLCIQTGIQPVSYVSVTRLMKCSREPAKSISVDEPGTHLSEATKTNFTLIDIYEPQSENNCIIINGTQQEIASTLRNTIYDALH